MTMRKLVFALAFVLVTVGVAQADIDVYVGDLNIYASRKFGEFKAELSARYGISGSRFDLMLKKVDSPGDLAVALWLGSRSLQPIDEVVRQYRIHRGKGWGVIAKELGIKPGSPEFKALKSGEIGWYPRDFEAVVRPEGAETPQQKKEKRRKKKEY